MKRKLSILLILVMAMTLLVPQSIFADETDDTYEGYRWQFNPPGIMIWGGPEAVSDTSIKVSWMDMLGFKGYKLCWKQAEENAPEESAIINNPAEHSYTIKGLEPGKKYEIRIQGIMTGYELKFNGTGMAVGIGDEKTFYTKVNDYETVFSYGYTYLNTPSYVKGSRLSTKDYNSMAWQVYEKDAQLQVYRAETEDGPYQLIGTVTGEENQEQILKKYSRHQIDFVDKSVEEGKAYYYKAKSVLQSQEGSRESDFSDAAVFVAKNMKEPLLASKLVNKRGTYSKTITWKVTSQAANYDIWIGNGWTGKSASLYTYSSNTGKRVKKALVRAEYSYDGRTFKELKTQSQHRLKPGKSIYLRVITKSKVWIRKDGKGFAKIKMNYSVPDLDYGLSSQISWEDTVKDMDLHMNGAITIHHFDGDDSSGESGYYEDDVKYYQNEDAWDRNLSGYALDSRTVIVSWYMVPKTAKFALRYGKTKEEAMKSKPVILPSWQVNYRVDGLEENQDYCFLLTDLRQGEPDSAYIENRTVVKNIRVASRPLPVSK